MGRTGELYLRNPEGARINPNPRHRFVHLRGWFRFGRREFVSLLKILEGYGLWFYGDLGLRLRSWLRLRLWFYFWLGFWWGGRGRLDFWLWSGLGLNFRNRLWGCLNYFSFRDWRNGAYQLEDMNLFRFLFAVREQAHYGKGKQACHMKGSRKAKSSFFPLSHHLVRNVEKHTADTRRYRHPSFP